MQYDILVKKGGFFCGYFYWLENNICQKRSGSFSPSGKKLSKSVSGYSKKKKEKKVYLSDLKFINGGVKTLVVRPIKKNCFMCVSSHSLSILVPCLQSTLLVATCNLFQLFRCFNLAQCSKFLSIFSRSIDQISLTHK